MGTDATRINDDPPSAARVLSAGWKLPLPPVHHRKQPDAAQLNEKNSDRPDDLEHPARGWPRSGLSHSAASGGNRRQCLLHIGDQRSSPTLVVLLVPVFALRDLGLAPLPKPEFLGPRMHAFVPVIPARKGIL